MFLLRTYWILHMGFRHNPDKWFVLAQWLNCKSLRAAFHPHLPPRVSLGQTGGSRVGQSVFVCVICNCHVASLRAKLSLSSSTLMSALTLLFSDCSGPITKTAPHPLGKVGGTCSWHLGGGETDIMERGLMSNENLQCGEHFHSLSFFFFF